MEWINRPKGNSYRYGCDDFRPERVHDDDVTLYANGVVPHVGEVLLEISSEHHATIAHHIAIEAIEQDAQWKELGANSELPDFLRSILVEGEVFAP